MKGVTTATARDVGLGGSLGRWLSGKRVTQLAFLIALALVWEATFRMEVVSELLFPSFIDILTVFWSGFGDLSFRLQVTFRYILYGMLLAAVLGVVLSFLAMISPAVASVLDMVLAVMHPLPAVALLPLLIIWFGLTRVSLVLVILTAALWPMLLNCYTGFRAVPQTYLETGRNIGLRGFRLIWSVMIPAALPYLIAGFASGWARAWRAAISVELVFGAAASEAGIGWYIYNAQFFLEMPQVVAAVLVIILVGIVVERLGLDTLERVTVGRWGMVQHAEGQT